MSAGAGSRATVSPGRDVVAQSDRARRRLDPAAARIAGAPLGDPDLDGTLAEIAERARSVAGAPVAWIALLDVAGAERTVPAVAGASPSAAHSERFRSIVRLRICAQKGDPIGVLYVADRVPRAFGSAAVALLESLAWSAALAIEGARRRAQDAAALFELRRDRSVVRSHNERLRGEAEVRRRLTDLLLGGHGLARIVAAIEQLAAAAAVVLDEDHRPLAHAGTVADELGRRLLADGLDADLRRAPEIQRVLSALADGASASCALGAGAGADADVRPWRVTAVTAAGEPLGSLWLRTDVAEADGAQALADLAAEVLALELLRQRSVTAVEQRLQRELLDDLLGSFGPSRDALERHAASLGVDLRAAHRLCVARPPSEALLDALRAAPWCAFAAEHEGDLVALLTSETADARVELERLLERVPARPRAVVSASSAGPDGHRDAFLLARRVLDALGAGASQTVIELAQARVLALLCRADEPELVRGFVEECLAPVEREDPGGRLSLVTTLEEYLVSGRSPGKTATALHVHVNTVYYRLERLRAALGDDFAEPRRSLDLQVACLARRLMDETPNKESEVQ